MSPEAIALPANLADIEQYPDILNEVAGNFQYISDSSGLVEVTTDSTATTATATLAGSVDRFASSSAVMRGDLGTPVTQEAFTYFVQSGGGGTVMPLAARTTHPSTTTADAQTTTYTYTFAPGTTQIVSQQTTLPTVTTAQNRPAGRSGAPAEKASPSLPLCLRAEPPAQARRHGAGDRQRLLSPSPSGTGPG